MHISGSNDLELICGLGGESLFQYRITQCVLGGGGGGERTKVSGHRIIASYGYQQYLRRCPVKE